MSRSEWIVGDDLNKLIWNRIKRLRSVGLCRGLIERKLEEANLPRNEKVISAKAHGLASAVDSATSYWETEPRNLNAWILTRYYGLMHLTIAEQVGSVRNDEDLESVQRQTVFGHGLNTVFPQGEEFPDAFYVYCRTQGHFSSYGKFRGCNLSSLEHEHQISESRVPEHKERLISGKELFRRIPELQSIIVEHLGVHPLSFVVSYDNKNSELEEKRREEYRKKTGKFVVHLPPDAISERSTYIAIHPNGYSISAEKLNSLGLPLKNIVLVPGEGDPRDSRFVGEFIHPGDGHWWQYLKTYRSSSAGTSIIAPIRQTIDDPILINFMLLYALSILVRYLPDTWNAVTHGLRDQIGSLIYQYMTAVDSALPVKMAESITGANITLAHPGSMYSPI